MVGSHATPRLSISRTGRAKGSSAKRRSISVATAERMQGGGGHPPRLARGPIAARRRQRRQMTEPLEAVAVDPEQFAAPGRAVGAEPEAVERKPEQRPLETMLGGKRGDMGVMVLHGYHRQPKPMGEREVGKSGCRSQAIATGSTSRIDSMWCSVSSRNSAAAGVSRSPTCCETKASRPRVTVTVALSCAPKADDAGNLVRQPDRRRREAARAAHKGRRAGDHADHAVVGARHDRPIMIDDQIGDAVEAAARIGAVDDDRFAGDIGRGRDQREIVRRGHPVEAGGTPEQFPDHQPVQWRIGQEQSDGRQSVGDTGRKRPLVARRHDDDRPLAAGEQPRGDRRRAAAKRRAVRHWSP